MSTLIAPASSNLHLSSLESRIDSQDINDIDCLVIAHPDGGMIQNLVGLLNKDTVAVLPLNQVEWDNQLDEIIDWAVKRSIRQIVICAHSKTVEPLMRPQIYRSGEAVFETSESTFDRIIAGTSNNEQRMSIAKDRFSAEMRRLAHSEEFRVSKFDAPLKITAVFYVAHSGFFMQFDITSGTYRPFS